MFNRKMDKSRWPPGQWQAEADYIEWVEPQTGYDCYIRRSDSGALCGYVTIPHDHLMFGAYYDDLPVDVHGGLTYAAEDANQQTWTFGFDCAHYNDYSPALSFRINPTHSNGTYRDMRYVQGQVNSLAHQLGELNVSL